MPHKFDVQVDPAVYDKMYTHIRFLAQVSIPAAERLYDSLNEAMNSLKETPKSCPIYQLQKQIHLDVELRYKICEKRYRIVFEIVDNFVYVYDIQDCRQDIDKSLV